MRYLRWLTIVAFIGTVAFFGYYKLKVESAIDKTSPVITMDTEEITVSVESTEAELLEGVAATDDRDGDVSSSLIVESESKFLSTGKFRISCAAFDESGNVGKAERIVHYSDYTSPEFKITEPLKTSEINPNFSPLQNITAWDCVDGDLTGMIKYKYGETSYIYEAGECLLSYQVTNSMGDTSKVELYVEILSAEDAYKPYPLLSEYLVYTDAGEKIDPSAYLTGVYHSGNITDFAHSEEEPEYTADMVKVSSDVDYNTPGTYRVTYTLYSNEDGEGTIAQGHAYLYVVVRE